MFSSNIISQQQHHSLIWFLLLDSATDQPFGGCTPDFVSLPPGSFVAQFRDAVHSKNVSILTGSVPSQLLVYKNAVDFDRRNSTVKDGDDDNGNSERQPPLHPTQSIQGLGSMEDMLVVVVPSSSMNTSSLPIRSTKEFSGDRVGPKLKRKQRWAEINKILEDNVKTPKANDEDSPDQSSIGWEQVKSIYQPIKYVQSQRVVDDAQIDFLKDYLRCTAKCFGAVSLGNEANRLHFIAPILVSVCMLFGEDDVRISVDENFPGKCINACGHFEFMIRRKNKAICIVQAKKDDFEQGMARCWVGCEVAAEVEGLDVVHGIVTNYVQWNFLRRGNDKVEMEETSVSLTPEGPEKRSLKCMAEKIYSMVSD